MEAARAARRRAPGRRRPRRTRGPRAPSPDAPPRPEPAGPPPAPRQLGLRLLCGAFLLRRRRSSATGGGGSSGRISGGRRSGAGAGRLGGLSDLARAGFLLLRGGSGGRRADVIGRRLGLGVRHLRRLLDLTGPARRAQRLVLELLQLGLVGAVLALQLQMLTDCFVEDAHHSPPRRQPKPKRFAVSAMGHFRPRCSAPTADPLRIAQPSAYPCGRQARIAAQRLYSGL